MGITLKTVSVKWDAETVRMSDELATGFAPFIEGRSQLTRLAISILHKIVSTHGTVHVVTQHLQGLPAITLKPALQPASIPTRFFPKFGRVAQKGAVLEGAGSKNGDMAPSHSEFEELLRRAAGVAN
jgi:hypothetical protein